ncbi:MAG: acetyl-CoA hydrolase [Lachnospiraceae bacterium]|nr:acetyl-CoA hydrolase [Lachnospiraceae bacterium]
MDRPDFYPVRSLIYVDLADEDYRIKLENWLYRYHVPDSIAQFGPYVSKYAFYPALPMPEGAERFGTVRMQLTEHYWLANPNDIGFAKNHHKALTEVFPKDVLVWQNNLPDEGKSHSVVKGESQNFEGDDARATKGNEELGTVPFIFAFIPVWWEDDLKGEGRTLEDGPNYRWQFMVKYPEGVSREEGDKWLMEEFLPEFAKQKEVNRILSSKIKKEVNNCEFDRVVEMWFDCPTAWKVAVKAVSESVKKPSWAETSDFPYLKKSYGISGIFLSDIARSDNLTQYRGYIPMR